MEKDGERLVRHSFGKAEFFQYIAPGSFVVDQGIAVKLVIAPKPGCEADGKTFEVTALKAQAQELSQNRDGLQVKDVTLTLIPYYAWNHRGAGYMDVWLAKSLSGLED